MTSEELKTVCDSVMARPELKPETVEGKLVTHCNQGARLIAQACGCHEFDELSLNAEAMGKIMEENASGKWIKVVGALAAGHANQGSLAIAFMSAEELKEGHAHIAVVYPAPMQFSGSLNEDVPMVANIGCQDQEEKESQAFPVSKGEASFYAWEG